jgi:hypothetical protein
MKRYSLWIAVLFVAPASIAAPQFDVFIRNGRIMDGTGSP